jgi:phage FluMu gp28-like protein
MIDLNVIDYYDELPDGNFEVFFGMDIGSKNDKSAICLIKRFNDVLYLDDIIVLNKMSYDEQLNIVKNTNLNHYIKYGYIDETGIGSAFAELVNKKVNSQIKGLSFTASNKSGMYEYLRSLIFSHKFFINRKFKKMIEDDFSNV